MNPPSNPPLRPSLISFLITITFLFSAEMYSQNAEIQARIIDLSNNKPVSFVTVYSNTTKGVISDESGFFRFQIADKQTADSLTLSCVGYHTNSVALAGFRQDALDTIYLTPQLFELDEVKVETKQHRPPKSRQIIKRAIAAIPENLHDFPVKFSGYYREYVKQEDKTINLLESMIELSDPGINSDDDFAAGLMYKRTSPDFQIDQGLMKSYDNVDKFVPHTIAPTATANELVLLRSHDPIRNYEKSALYYIDCLESKFVRNHVFDAPNLTYLDGTPYYHITFIDNRPAKRDGINIATEGTIFIDAINYGIKKLNYKGFAEEGISKKKLFELSLEYKHHDEHYLLNYLSFNNLFMIRNFSIVDVDVYADVIGLTFSRPVNTTGLSRNDFRVFWQDKELIVKTIRVLNGNRQIELSIDGSDVIHSEQLSFEIANLTDRDGNPFENEGLREFYQYRELFVRDFQTDNTLITENLIQKHKPVFETRIFGEMNTDTYWFNTPLSTEDPEIGDIPNENPIIQAGVENLYHRNAKTVNETVYLHTDREVYAPSDTLWFKAYIRDLKDLDTTDLSQTLFVKLIDDRGITIDQGRFFIKDSDAVGQFILDHQLNEGVYFITAHSSWMQNYDTDQLYRKKILIRNEQRKGLQMVLSLDRNSYHPGDTIKAVVRCYDELNRDVADINYSYRVLAGKESIARGRMQTLPVHQDTIRFTFTDRFQGISLFEITGNHKGQILDTTFSIPVIQGVHVGFFPEGGSSINGLESIIAFKAQTLQGEPVYVKSEIVDTDGKVVTIAKSEHDGMGLFGINPVPDQSLFMRITDPPGIDSLYPVPPGLDRGWQLTGSSNPGLISLRVSRKDTPGDIALITIMVRGYLAYNTQIRVDGSQSIEIPTAGLPPGIAVVTLFDHEMQPQAERLFHINPREAPGIRMESDRKTYIPRDRVRLNIRPDSSITAQLKGSYSLSVVDVTLCLTNTIQEPNIRTSFLLSPEIKGTIHNPNYYLDQGSPEVRHHLDLLLRTQGWRNYTNITDLDWEKQVSPIDREIVSGTLLRQPFGKEYQPSEGIINVFFGGSSVKIPVDQSGRFMFRPEYDMDFNSGILVSGEVNGTSSYTHLKIDHSGYEKNLPEYLGVLMDSIREITSAAPSDYLSLADQFSLGLTYHEWIEEVAIVRAGGRPKDEDFEIILEDFITTNKIESRPEYLETAIDLIGVLYNMGIPVDYDPVEDEVTHLPYPRSVIGWVVDDSYYGTKFSFVQNFVPSSIEKLFLVKHVETKYYGSNMPEVVVSIRLKTFDRDQDSPDEIQSKHNISSFIVSKEFYEPVYDTEKKRKSTIPDLRKTILWDPDVEMDADGNATVEFFNGDRYTNIKCILEGITHTGVPIYSEYTYDVSLYRD